MSINSLPLEIKNYIIDLSGNLRTTEVCNEWHGIVQNYLPKTIISNYPKFKHRFTLVNGQSIPFLSVLKDFFEKIVDIDRKEAASMLRAADVSLSIKLLKLKKIIKDKKTVLKEIEKVPLNTEKISLRLLDIEFLTNKVCDYRSLKKLKIQESFLNKLPKGIVNLTCLGELDLDLNAFEAFPKEIIKLTQLETLCLSNNKIKEIPIDVIKLSKLNLLNISHNQIKRIPKEMGNFRNLALWVVDNKLTTVPIKCFNLISIELNNNPIVYFPKSIMQKIKMKNQNLNDDYVFDLFKDIKILKDFLNNPQTLLPLRLICLIGEFSKNIELNKMLSDPEEIQTFKRFPVPITAELSKYMEHIRKEQRQDIEKLLYSMESLLELQNKFLNVSVNEQEKLEILIAIQNFYQGDGELQQQQVIEVIFTLAVDNNNKKLSFMQTINKEKGFQFVCHALDPEMKEMLKNIKLMRDGEAMFNQLKQAQAEHQKKLTEMQKKLENTESKFEIIKEENAQLKEKLRMQNAVFSKSPLEDFKQTDEVVKRKREEVDLEIENKKLKKVDYQKRKDAFLKKAIEKEAVKSMQEISDWLKEKPDEALWKRIKESFPNMKEEIIEIENQFNN